MNPVIAKTRDVLSSAIASEVALSPDARVLWSAMLASDPALRAGHVGAVIASAGWHHSTTVDRLAKSGLPSVYRCLDYIGLCDAAALFDGEDDRVMTVASALGHANQHSFRRFTLRVWGTGPTALRDAVGFPTAREALLDALIRPYRARWSTFQRISPAGRVRLQRSFARMQVQGVPA